jgi:hypothetical protein
MDLNLNREVAALQRLTVAELRQRYAEVFGEATAAQNRAWLIKRIAWLCERSWQKPAGSMGSLWLLGAGILLCLPLLLYLTPLVLERLNG